jgi:hypothetical protein
LGRVDEEEIERTTPKRSCATPARKGRFVHRNNMLFVFLLLLFSDSIQIVFCFALCAN